VESHPDDRRLDDPTTAGRAARTAQFPVLHYSAQSSRQSIVREADMKIWEYKIINVRSENYSMDPRRAEELNRLGDEGWELVSITSINFKTGATDHIGMVFKREKAAEKSA
jgi:hypothetical protein